MIKLHRLERLGNILSQYCFARVLARRFGYRLSACSIAGFWTQRAVFGEEILEPEVRWEGQWPRDAYTGRKLEPAELYYPPGAAVTVRGWFQRFEYIANIRDEVRNDWVALDDPPTVRSSNDFLICLRLTDYLQDANRITDPFADSWANSVLQTDEIRRLVKLVKHHHLYIVTDEPEHPIIQSLRDLGAELFSKGGIADFRFIHSFQKVAICQSTFHWWATFLGAAKEVYFPPLNRGLWSRPQPADAAWQPGHYGIDLRVDEGRYVYGW